MAVWSRSTLPYSHNVAGGGGPEGGVGKRGIGPEIAIRAFDLADSDPDQSMMKPDERRAHPRVEIWISAMLTVVAPDRPELIRRRSVTVVDLSERGAMVSLGTEPDFCRILIEENRNCRLEFPPSTGLPAEVMARTVWVQPSADGDEGVVCLGLFFENLPPEISREIRRYLKEAAAQ